VSEIGIPAHEIFNLREVAFKFNRLNNDWFFPIFWHFIFSLGLLVTVRAANGLNLPPNLFERLFLLRAEPARSSNCSETDSMNSNSHLEKGWLLHVLALSQSESMVSMSLRPGEVRPGEVRPGLDGGFHCEAEATDLDLE
ncbi:MAG: hypothetical protein IT572_09520, partial [Deltaproteobacteria bacterium]|nr:hypothetical protein [Deltaproteobacteria bacterium]